MSKVKPKPKQLEFLEWEFGTFFHFGIRTFYEGHRDWDGKEMPLSGFMPSELDCGNWIRISKEAGAKYAILVCKHHDGFANWPSEYTEYSVKNTPWKDGKGDVVQEFVDACRKYELKVGLYYSPAEAGFKERTAEEYDDYFINQIGELLKNYGKIDYLWFDGCGSEGHEFNKARIIKAIRGMQPEILIFNMWDQDTRWVGNECGFAEYDNSNVVSNTHFSVMTDEKDELGSVKFLPAECDFMMRDNNWFYSDKDTHTVKSVDELVGLYYYSVGHGANYLINIGPDRRGLLPEPDAAALLGFGEEIRRRFGNPVESEFKQTEKGGVITISGGAKFINHIVLREDLSDGESVKSFKIYVSSPLIKTISIYEGKTIGNKRIIILPTVKPSELTIEVTDSNGEFKLLKPEVYYVK